MPYCTIEEAWGIPLTDNSTINPKIADNRIENTDKTSRNFEGLPKTNSSERYSRNKGKIDINLDEQPGVNIDKPKKKEKYSICNHNVPVQEEQIKEGFENKIDILLKENMFLKEQLKKGQNNNSELILFCILGIFLIYTFELFIRFGKK